MRPATLVDHQMLRQMALLEERLVAVRTDMGAFAGVPHVVLLQQLASAKLFAALF